MCLAYYAVENKTRAKTSATRRTMRTINIKFLRSIKGVTLEKDKKIARARTGFTRCDKID